MCNTDIKYALFPGCFNVREELKFNILSDSTNHFKGSSGVLSEHASQRKELPCYQSWSTLKL